MKQEEYDKEIKSYSFFHFIFGWSFLTTSIVINSIEFAFIALLYFSFYWSVLIYLVSRQSDDR